VSPLQVVILPGWQTHQGDLSHIEIAYLYISQKLGSVEQPLNIKIFGLFCAWNIQWSFGIKLATMCSNPSKIFFGHYMLNSPNGYLDHYNCDIIIRSRPTDLGLCYSDVTGQLAQNSQRLSSCEGTTGELERVALAEATTWHCGSDSKSNDGR